MNRESWNAVSSHQLVHGLYIRGHALKVYSHLENSMKASICGKVAQCKNLRCCICHLQFGACLQLTRVAAFEIRMDYESAKKKKGLGGRYGDQ